MKTPPPFLLLIAASTLSACASTDNFGQTEASLSTNPIVPIDEPSLLEGVYDHDDVLVESYRVTYDNPTYGGQFRMPWGEEITTSVRRSGDHWTYDYFDIESELYDAATMLQVPRRRKLSPEKLSVTQSWEDDPEFDWYGHGLQLSPLGLASQVKLYEDDWQNPDVTYVSAHFHLDDQIPVVPVRVIVLYGDAYPASDLTEFDAALLFDGDWRGIKSINTSPGYAPEQVNSRYTNRPGLPPVARYVDGEADQRKHFQPDMVFHQCGVQFRMVEFSTCWAPDYVLKADGCNAPNQGSTIDQYVSMDCGWEPNNGTIDVVIVGELVDPSSACVGGDTLGGYSSTLVKVARAATAPILAHEIGHAFSMSHSVPCSPVNNLMCAQPSGEEVPHISSADCADALSEAWTKANLYW